MNQPIKNPQGQQPIHPGSSNVTPQQQMRPATGRPVGNVPGNAPQSANRPGPQQMRPQGSRPMQYPAGTVPGRQGYPAGSVRPNYGQQRPPSPIQPQPVPQGTGVRSEQTPHSQPLPQGTGMRSEQTPHSQTEVAQNGAQSQTSTPSAGSNSTEQNAAHAHTSASTASNPFVPNFATDFNLSPVFISSKGILGMLLGVLCLGIIFGSIFFGGSNNAPQPTGLQGVIRNSDVPARFPRCGRIDRGQACVLYIMNSTRYDKLAEDFFPEAVKLTEIQRYSIEMANPKYAKTRIPPGHFAEIKIPNVR